jgi:superfamily II RNA helicase
LWLAIVLQQPSVKMLNAAELAAVMCAVVVDGYKAANSYFKYPASDKVQAVYGELEQLSWDLKLAQTEANIEFPVHLSREAGGLVESWVNGVSWRELCRDTSLDQGDLCRMLRRTVESLRQV